MGITKIMNFLKSFVDGNYTVNNLSLRCLLKNDQLNGANFNDWSRNLKIVFKNQWRSLNFWFEGLKVLDV